MTAVMIKLKRESYKPDMNCTLYLKVPPGYGLLAFVVKLKMRRSANKADFIEFYSNTHSLIRFHGNNEEMEPTKTIITGIENDLMVIRFVSESIHHSLPGKGFKIIANLYTRNCFFFINKKFSLLNLVLF